ncbi:uncharacterized protein LAESUDRAFT_718236 [Laetiporus sulphureus 93-53]|uniref:Uncharacterized protein n=1 Tax=Laetiporus sulphureus 93-53 TaxID=1314785 RepID=A0A165B623_9APHY|nr:uncharacterized protein LAESUDRAFT_718236 [Laetiporus sulphureus 93-53]KZT00321.1 hypothetical protein LAESUDRAFT_718236 [Laetiporus sulphureus 93-53]
MPVAIERDPQMTTFHCPIEDCKFTMGFESKLHVWQRFTPTFAPPTPSVTTHLMLHLRHQLVMHHYPAIISMIGSIHENADGVTLSPDHPITIFIQNDLLSSHLTHFAGKFIKYGYTTVDDMLTLCALREPVWMHFIKWCATNANDINLNILECNDMFVALRRKSYSCERDEARMQLLIAATAEGPNTVTTFFSNLRMSLHLDRLQPDGLQLGPGEMEHFQKQFHALP